jgi:O-antigen/teichoic acid export membrane protein
VTSRWGVFARQTLDIYLFQAMSLGASLLVSIVVARSLGPDNKGVADLFAFLATLVAEIALLGTNGGFLYLLANRGRSPAEVHGAALLYAGMAGLAGMICALVVADWVATLLAIPEEYAALAVGLAGPMVYLATWPSLLIGLDHAPLVYRVQFLLIGANALVTGGLWATGSLDLPRLIGWMVLWWILAAGAQICVLLRIHRPHSPRPRVAVMKDATTYGLRLYPGGLANWIHFRSDQFVLASFLGTGAVGMYAVSARWAELLLLVGYGVAAAGTHRIAASEARAGHRFARQLALLVLAMTGCVGALLCLLAPVLVPGLYGEAFRGAVIPLIVLVPGMVMWDGARILSQYISLNAGRPEVPTVIAIFGAAMNVGLAIALVPAIGIVGAALASTLTYGGVFAATWITFLRWNHVPKAD